MAVISLDETHEDSVPLERRQRVAQGLGVAIEVILLVVIFLSPWPFGSVHPFFEGLIYLGTALLLVLWGLRMVLQGRLVLAWCPVLACLAGLFLLAMVQLLPLSTATLARLSPTTAALYARCLPQPAEQLPPGESLIPTAIPAGSTLSVYPGATRQSALRFLAVLLVYLVVRNNLDPGPALRRLAVVATVNGVLLTLLGLAQFVSSSRNTVYWTFTTQGAVFGPFVCRTHFAFYVNICIGLGLGWLFAILAHYRARGETGFSLGAWFERPAVLWVCVALALMAAGVACSLSRGGFFSLLGGLLTALLIQWSVTRHSAGWHVALLIVLLTAGLIAWIGWDEVQARLETVWKLDPLEEGRVRILLKVLPLAAEFPILGVGYGNFEIAERLCSKPGDDPSLAWDHAHNEYLEGLIEGGAVRLFLMLLGVFFVLRLGYRACRRLHGRRAGGLAVGAMVGFCTVLYQSTVDYGIHYPAIAVLATTVAALLAGLGAESGLLASPPSHRKEPASPKDSREPGGPPRHAYYDGPRRRALSLGGIAPVVGLAVTVGLGLLLAIEGHRLDRVGRHLIAALWAARAPDTRAEQIQHLQAAAHWAPENALIPTELANAYALSYEEENAAERQRQAGSNALQALLLPCVALQPGLGALPATSVAVAFGIARVQQFESGEPERTRRYGLPALRYALHARALGPLLPAPHARLAAFANLLVHGDSPRVYLERAHALRPADPELTYLLGLQCYQDGAYADAWRFWREALEFSDKHLSEVVERSARVLSPEELIGEVLPARPQPLYQAAEQLFPEEGDARRRVFLERAVPLFNRLPAPVSATDLILKARAHQQLEQPAEAAAAYLAAVAREPHRTDWRLEAARLLYEQKQLSEADNQLRLILREQPAHSDAIHLREKVLRDMLESK